jgi:hypothetical protein
LQGKKSSDGIKMSEETAIKFCRLCHTYSEKIFQEHGDYHAGTRDELVPRDDATKTAMNSLESAINSEDTPTGRDDALNEALAACRDCDYKLPLIADILLGTKEEKRTIKIGPGIVDLSRPSSANNEPTEALEDIENTTNQAAQIHDTTLTSYLSRKRAEGSYQSEIYNPEPTQKETEAQKADRIFDEIVKDISPPGTGDVLYAPKTHGIGESKDTPLDDILGTNQVIEQLDKIQNRAKNNAKNGWNEDASGDTLMNIDADILFGEDDVIPDENMFDTHLYSDIHPEIVPDNFPLDNDPLKNLDSSKDDSGDTLMNIDADILFGETEDDERKLFEDDDLI